MLRAVARTLGLAIPAALLSPLLIGTAQAAAPSSPGKPSFQVVTTRAGDVDVRASWAAPSSGTAARYNYNGGVNGGGDWSASGQVTSRSVLLTRLPRGGSYWFCVNATNSRGETGGNACNSVTTPDPVVIPGDTGTPQFEVTPKATGADVKVTWTAGSDAAGYRYSGGAEAGSWTTGSQVTQPLAQLVNVPLNGSYWFCVNSFNSAGESGNRCNSFSTPAGGTDGGIGSIDPPGGVAVRECSAAKAEWIWCDDFEVDRISSYFEASMQRDAGVGVGGSQGVTGRYHLGTPEAGNLKLAFGRTPHSRFKAVDGGSRNYREIYWRVYVKTQPNWQGGAGYKLSRAMVLAGSSWQQAMIAHVWGTASSGAHLMIDPASGTSTSGSLQTTRYNDFNNLRWLGARRSSVPLFEKPNTGEWHCVEAHVRLNDSGKSNGIFELWEDGELSTSRNDLNWVGSYNAYGLNAVFLENYWNGGSPVEQERHLDNFVVSTAPIGCGSN